MSVIKEGNNEGFFEYYLGHTPSQERRNVFETLFKYLSSHVVYSFYSSDTDQLIVVHDLPRRPKNHKERHAVDYLDKKLTGVIERPDRYRNELRQAIVAEAELHEDVIADLLAEAYEAFGIDFVTDGTIV